MAQGSHPADTCWIVVEPDLCLYKAEAVSRIECVQGHMPEAKFKDYEAFAEEITDPGKKAEFVRQLSGWRELQVYFGVEHVPWPGNPQKPADPKAVAPWNVKVEVKAAKVPVLPKPKKFRLQIQHKTGVRRS